LNQRPKSRRRERRPYARSLAAIAGHYVIPAAHADRKIGGSTNPIRDRDDYANVIVVAPETNRHRPRYECEANARLIAAAPEMLDALREAETVLMIVEPRSHKAEYIFALGKVRDAIAKATLASPWA
jgi:hypothetical protein